MKFTQREEFKHQKSSTETVAKVMKIACERQKDEIRNEVHPVMSFLLSTSFFSPQDDREMEFNPCSSSLSFH